MESGIEHHLLQQAQFRFQSKTISDQDLILAFQFCFGILLKIIKKVNMRLWNRKMVFMAFKMMKHTLRECISSSLVDNCLVKSSIFCSASANASVSWVSFLLLQNFSISMTTKCVCYA